MSNFVRLLALGVALVGVGIQGCSTEAAKDHPDFVPPGAGGEPEGLVVTPPALPPGESGAPAGPAPGVISGTRTGVTITLPSGAEIVTTVIEGKRYVPIEATFTERSWQAIVGKAGFDGLDKAGRDAAVTAELQAILKKIAPTARVVGAEFVPSVGFVSAYVPLEAYSSLATITGLGRRMLVNPITRTPMEKAERDMKTDKELGFAAAAGTPFGQLEGLVGLAPMGVNEFIAEAAADLDGYRPNGSHVKLGVVDTGLTYNHPAFRDAQGVSRVESMRDFTGEARMFFLPNARFEVKPGATPDALLLSADFMAAPKKNTDAPNPAAVEIDGETILVPAALRALLDAPNASGARFGVLDEIAYGGGVDLNLNGKEDDRFYAILVPGQNGQPDAVWVAVAGKGDFRKSPRLTSFDLAREVMQAGSEKFGLDIKRENVLDAAGADLPVTTAAVVGFDPGNHGSHVMGIAAARKIIQNAPDDTDLRGVAPLARLMSGRICAKNGGGCQGTKAIAELSNAGAEVINMSIGGLGPDNDGYGVQEAVIDRLTVQNGTVFVIAAANDGPGRQTVGSPSVARYSIAVAATGTQKMIDNQYHWPGSGKNPSSDGSEDFLMYFSSRGPTSAGGMKPDLAAPGTWLSAIQLNAAPGEASGLDVMWGTSMASPAAAGAVALFLDAAKVYNEGHGNAPVAVDAPTLRRVLLASARPFDVTTLDTKTQATTNGQYTWIDQGFGMLNLPRAWKMLKAERKARNVSAVSFTENGKAHAVGLDYQVRVLRKNPNGMSYDGTVTEQGLGDGPEAKFGRGLWIDAKTTESIFKVQVARRLPSDVIGRPDVAELATQLKTTADEFELETTIHGSHLNWVRPGVTHGNDCNATPPVAGAPQPRVLVIGEGAFDQPINPTTGAGGSVAQSSSIINVCVNRALVDQLPPGDHGAIVTAYRIIGNAREAVPSFTVPVYVTVPHKTMAGPEGLHVTSTVSSFGVGRHYVDVPKGTTIVKIKLEVPAATQTGTAVSGCGGVILEALEGGNTAKPPEFETAPGDAVIQSCSGAGKLAPDEWRSVTLTRTNPTPGIWDVHVFGLYNFTQSPYTLDVSFAKVSSSKIAIDGPAAALTSSFDIDVVDASFPLVLSQSASTFAMSSFVQELTATVAHEATVRVKNAAGQENRVYGDDVSMVTIATSNSPGNDLDLQVLECDAAAPANCALAGTSGGATEVESVSFVPKPGKVYVAEVIGYKVVALGGNFTVREEQAAKTPEKGTLTMTQPTPKKFTFATAFDAAGSALLRDARFTTGAYTVQGAIDVKDEAGTVILRIPVRTKQ